MKVHFYVVGNAVCSRCASQRLLRANVLFTLFNCAELLSIKKGTRAGGTKTKIVLVPSLVLMVVYILDWLGWKVDGSLLVQTMVSLRMTCVV